MLTPQDGDHIDHMLGVLSVAISELLASKRIHIPESPHILPAEEQLYREKNDITGEMIRSDPHDYDNSIDF